MLTGLPPLYCEDQKKMFSDIISKPIPYPSYLSKKAVSLLNGLLQIDPEKRLGYGESDAKIIKKHEFFDSLNFKELLSFKITPPLKLNVKDDKDLKYFDRKILN